MVFRTRDLLVRQRTQAINALRGHVAEFGVVVAKGPFHVPKLIAVVEDPASPLPETVRVILAILIDQWRALDKRVGELDTEIARRAKEDATARRLMTIPGIGAVTATALAALAPPVASFRRGRDFAAWLGLTPLQRSTGGKQKLGATSKMGERTLRRLLVIGASAVVRHASRRGLPSGSWLARMLQRKPRMLVTVALAHNPGPKGVPANDNGLSASAVGPCVNAGGLQKRIAPAVPSGRLQSVTPAVAGTSGSDLTGESGRDSGRL